MRGNDVLWGSNGGEVLDGGQEMMCWKTGETMAWANHIYGGEGDDKRDPQREFLEGALLISVGTPLVETFKGSVLLDGGPATTPLSATCAPAATNMGSCWSAGRAAMKSAAMATRRSPTRDPKIS